MTIIPAQTILYVYNIPNYELCIKPGSIITDTVYLLYDFKIDGVVVLPKNTKMTGSWITESVTNKAQLQIDKIYFNNNCNVTSYDFVADSNTYSGTVLFNDVEVNNAISIRKKIDYYPSTYVHRRIVKINCGDVILLDNDLNSTYINIFTGEIMITLLDDFVL